MPEVDPSDIDVTVSPSITGGGHEAAEGADSSGAKSLGNPDNWMDALLQTKPHPDLDNVDPLWDPDNGGLARIKRGVRKAGLPTRSAAWDIAVGMAEAVSSFTWERTGEDEDEIVGQP